MSVVARVSVIIADAIVIGATWLRMRHQVSEAFDARMRETTSMVMLTDGAPTFRTKRRIC